MPIELIAALVLRQAYKLIVLPVATGVRQRIVDQLSEKIAAPVSERLFGDHAPGANSGATSGTDADAGFKADEDFVDTIQQEPQARAVLGEEMERILDVNLSTAGAQGGAAADVRTGSPRWYVSNYAAILWRIAMLAVWEERPIAIHGALQGQGWVTVCVPRVAKAIAPSAMWRKSDSAMLLRLKDDRPPADFFVRQIKSENARAKEVAALNDKFMINTKAAFKETIGGSIADNWHRIDGIDRKWVLLKPDTETGIAILNNRSPFLDATETSLFLLKASPPTFDEYPAEWQPLLKIGKEADAIKALSAGADEFARASEASAAAVEAALDADAH